MSRNRIFRIAETHSQSMEEANGETDREREPDGECDEDEKVQYRRQERHIGSLRQAQRPRRVIPRKMRLSGAAARSAVDAASRRAAGLVRTTSSATYHVATA
jgi:hypothetical protein